MDWIDLDDILQLEKLEEISKDKTVIIFKHSTRCGVSSMVLKSLNKALEGKQYKNTDFYYLDLIKHRNISNTIADKWLVEHQSPQIIILENGTVSNHASHYQIDASLLPSA